MNLSELIGTATPWWLLYFTLLAVALGAAFGSFLNVCIYRIPNEMSIILPSSHCPRCSARIAWFDNIPLFSFLALGTRCRHCKGLIAWRYFLVELLATALFLLVWLKFGWGPTDRPMGLAPITNVWLVPIYWLALCGLILGTFVDFDYYYLPDRVTWGGIVAGLLLSTLVPSLQYPQWPAGTPPWHLGLWQSALGAASGFSLLWLVARLGRWAYQREAMGFGDVKLLGAIGAFFGWQGMLFTLMLSAFVGAMVGLALVFAGKKSMQSKLPFGPYLALAATIWILWGPRLLSTYLQWLTGMHNYR